MITKYNEHHFWHDDTEEDIEYKKNKYKKIVYSYLNDDIKKLIDKTKDTIDWDLLIKDCQESETEPSNCAIDIRDRILNIFDTNITKEINPKIINKKENKPIMRDLKPRPEILNKNTTNDKKEWIDRDPYESKLTKKFTNFVNENKKDEITLEFWGSYIGTFKKVKNGWQIVSGIFPKSLAKDIIKDYDKKHDVEKEAEIGLTYADYPILPYFSEVAGGGFKLLKDIVISNKLFNEIKKKYE